jgi:hypothetical protein
MDRPCRPEAFRRISTVGTGMELPWQGRSRVLSKSVGVL